MGSPLLIGASLLYNVPVPIKIKVVRNPGELLFYRNISFMKNYIILRLTL